MSFAQNAHGMDKVRRVPVAPICRIRQPQCPHQGRRAIKRSRCELQWWLLLGFTRLTETVLIVTVANCELTSSLISISDQATFRFSHCGLTIEPAGLHGPIDRLFFKAGYVSSRWRLRQFWLCCFGVGQIVSGAFSPPEFECLEIDCGARSWPSSMGYLSVIRAKILLSESARRLRTVQLRRRTCVSRRLAKWTVAHRSGAQPAASDM